MMNPPKHGTATEASERQDFHRAVDVVLFWKPGTSNVLILEIGNEPPGGSPEYPCSGMGAYSVYERFTDVEARASVFVEACKLIVRDKCDPVAVHNAFLWVQEYRDGIPMDMFNLDR